VTATTWQVMEATQPRGHEIDHIDPDWQVLELVAKGDREAFTRLVERHQQRVLTLCHRLLDDRDEALDASQEVFLKAFREARRFEPKARVSTWLHRIATNHCLNRLRRRAILRWVPFVSEGEDGEDRVFEPIAETADPDQQWAARRELAAVRRAVSHLPPNQRVVLALVRFEGMSYRQAAETLGITEGAVESRLVRAMRRLQAARATA
jgi:RNA polymerase sigma-70 factor (ECF subfamily)